jgi:hypothetical protein
MQRSVLALLVVVCVAGCSDSPTSEAGPTSTPSTTSSATAPTTTVDDAEREPWFDVTPSSVAAGATVVVSGSGCPGDPAWAEDTGFDFSVVVGAAIDGNVRAATVHPPSGEPGHVSFELVPEYDEQRVADATPDANGEWSTTWEIPADAATGDLIVSALCLGGPGLEAGYVHYGGIALGVQGTGNCPRSSGSSPAVFEADAGTYSAEILAFDASTNLIDFDVVQWLSGQDAVDAWHEEYPDDPDGPPNDYFVRNDNPLAREASVAQSADVRLVRLETDGSADVTAGTLSELPAYLTTTPFSTFWLTFEGGTVTAICEQYVP